MSADRSRLAVHGGVPAVPDGTIQKWPWIEETDERMVLEALRGPNQARGEHSLAFEREFAEWNGNRHAIFTNSGTAALHMGLAGCGVGAGDHVLVTAYTWSSSATCALHHNAIPVFVDIDFDTINMDIEQIEAALTQRTKAIVAVHLHGLPLDMDRIMSVARKHNLKVVEDACQAHGALFKGRKAGTLGDCAAFSFNQNKCLCTGEGGMFVTDSDEIRDGAAQLWSFGETRMPEQSRDYHAYALGWMYRSNEITAACGRAQLRKYPRCFEMLRANAAVVHERLAGVPGLIRPVEPEGHTHNWYNYCLRLDMDAVGWDGPPRVLRDAARKAIQAEGVPVSVWQQFILPEMTVFQARNAYGGGFPWSIPGANEGVDYSPDRFPVAQRHCDTYISLVQALRAPNGAKAAAAVAEGILKVFEHMDAVKTDAAKQFEGGSD